MFRGHLADAGLARSSTRWRVRSSFEHQLTHSSRFSNHLPERSVSVSNALTKHISSTHALHCRLHTQPQGPSPCSRAIASPTQLAPTPTPQHPAPHSGSPLPSSTQTSTAEFCAQHRHPPLPRTPDPYLPTCISPAPQERQTDQPIPRQPPRPHMRRITAAWQNRHSHGYLPQTPHPLLRPRLRFRAHARSGTPPQQLVM